MPSTPCCPSRWPAPSPPAAWRGCGASLLLLACAGAASAQVSMQRMPKDLAVSAGPRLRVAHGQALLADADRTRSPAAATVGAGDRSKLVVEWRPAKATLGLEHGALGMQLESGSRLSFKVRHGGPSLYLRSQF